MIAVDLSKQQILDANTRANQHISFKIDIDRGNDDTYTRIYFILEEAKETKLEFSRGTVKVL